MPRTGRPPLPKDQRPIRIETALRLYPGRDDELIAYFAAFKPGQYATAIKCALLAGSLVGLPSDRHAPADDPIELDAFVS